MKLFLALLLSAWGGTVGAAVVAPFAQSTHTGGNPRHRFAVDLQTARTSPLAVASGAYSVLIGGSNNVASGDYSLAGAGYNNVASGFNSTAIGGSGNVSIGTWSVALGFDNFANGDYSFCAGSTDNRAEGLQCMVLGGATSFASNAVATCLGAESAKAYNDYCMVLGGQANVASNVNAFAIGGKNVLSLGAHGIGIGNDITNLTAYSVMIGHRINAMTVASNGAVAVKELTIGPNGAGLTNMLSATAVLDFPSTLTHSSANLTIAVAGAADGDTVELAVPTASILVNSCYTGWASNAVVYVSFNNYSAISKDPASGTFRAVVRKWR